MNERSWTSGVTKQSWGRSRAGVVLLAIGVLAAALPGCAPSRAPTQGQRMLLEPARMADRAGDYEKALRIYRSAAEGGVPVAQYQLARMYDQGRGTEQSDAEAARWYQAAAERGYPQAQLALARMYDQGRGVPKDDVQALAWYRAAAEYERSAEYRLKPQRYPALALAMVGEFIERGRGTEADPAGAVQYYRWAADMGNPDGQFRLAELYRRGNGIEQDEAQAAGLYLAAATIYERRAAGGDANAQARLGEFYLYGYGVSADPDRALTWLVTAAESGRTSALDRLGQVFESGAGGVAANPALAVYYYARAGAGGHGGAKGRLAALYASGKAGQEDGVRVLQSFAEHAWQGDGRAAYKLAEAFDRGVVVSAEPLEALTWYRIAQSLGDDRAAEGAARLAERLGSAKSEAAVAAANAWQRERDGAETRPASFEAKG